MWHWEPHYLKVLLTVSISICSSFICMKKQTVPEVQYHKRKKEGCGLYKVQEWHFRKHRYAGIKVTQKKSFIQSNICFWLET